MTTRKWPLKGSDVPLRSKWFHTEVSGSLLFEKSWRIQRCPSPASQKGVVASSSSCCKDSPAAVVPSLKTSALASQRRGEYLGRGKDVKEVSESHRERVKMTTHYFNSRLTMTSGQRLCHSLSIRIQQDVTLRPQKSPLLIWLGCCSQKVDGHSCSDPTSYSLFTLILPNLHQNRPQMDPDSIDALYRKEFNGLPCPPLPFRRVWWPAAQLFRIQQPK